MVRCVWILTLAAGIALAAASCQDQPGRTMYDVVILDVAIGIADDVTRVDPGNTYQLNARVFHDHDDPALYQQVRWEIAEQTAGAGSTHVTADNVLHVDSAVWARRLTLTARSAVDPFAASNILELNVNLASNVTVINITSFHTLTEGGSSYYLDTGGRVNEGRSGTIIMPDGAPGIYMENAAFTAGAQSNPSSAAMMLALNFPAVNTSGSAHLAFDIAFENESVKNALTGFYPRIIGAASSGSGSARWNYSESFVSFKQTVRAGVFTALEVPLDSGTVFRWAAFNSSHPTAPNQMPTHVNQILGHVSTVLLEFYAPANVPGRIYFRNLRFVRD